MQENKDVSGGFPKRSSGDFIHSAAKIVSSSGADMFGTAIGIPGLGSAVTEIWNYILKPPLTKRTEAFIIDIHSRLTHLENVTDGFKIQNLQDNQVFISVLLQAIHIALRNHQETKIEALKNIVINTAKPTFAEDDVLLTFTHLIDIFTPSHIKILSYLGHVDIDIKDGKLDTSLPSQFIDVILHKFPEMRQQRGFILQVINDLYNHGLILEAAPVIDRENSEPYAYYTTETGSRFLEHISS